MTLLPYSWYWQIQRDTECYVSNVYRRRLWQTLLLRLVWDKLCIHNENPEPCWHFSDSRVSLDATQSLLLKACQTSGPWLQTNTLGKDRDHVQNSRVIVPSRKRTGWQGFMTGSTPNREDSENLEVVQQLLYMFGLHDKRITMNSRLTPLKHFWGFRTYKYQLCKSEVVISSQSVLSSQAALLHLIMARHHSDSMVNLLTVPHENMK